MYQPHILCFKSTQPRRAPFTGPANCWRPFPVLPSTAPKGLVSPTCQQLNGGVGFFQPGTRCTSGGRGSNASWVKTKTIGQGLNPSCGRDSSTAGCFENERCCRPDRVADTIVYLVLILDCLRDVKLTQSSSKQNIKGVKPNHAGI